MIVSEWMEIREVQIPAAAAADEELGLGWQGRWDCGGMEWDGCKTKLDVKVEEQVATHN